MPTDTLYGIVGLAEEERVVERIYKTRKRNPDKPCIILISDMKDLEKFSINLTPEEKNKLKEYWQATERPTSIILDCPDDRFSYLHRGTKTLAFRMPAQIGLRNLLKEVGPLVDPSAKIEGMTPAKNIPEAKNYFGDLVDLYIDGGELAGNPSRIIKLLKDGNVDIIRQ
jgi:L-threonylcarbamoyladenylate synthase